MTLTKQGGRWVALSTYDERAIPKAAGFRWDAVARQWFTDSREIAARLAAHASPEVQAELAGIAPAAPVPAGRALLGYQAEGVAFLAAHRNALVADEMGLGKTIQAIVAVNADPSAKAVLIVCPASLKLNWQIELGRWLTRPLTVGIAAGTFVPTTDIVIVNYDIVAKNRAALDARSWDVLIADEAHALKNGQAQRTKAVLGGGKGASRVEPIKAGRKIFLTGTPILNRPCELWTLLHATDRNGLGSNFMDFHKRYCNAHQTLIPGGRLVWNMTGASNLDELQGRLRAGIMLRRLKADVLTELPAKRRQIIEVGVNGSAAIVRAERMAHDAAEEALVELRARVALADAADNRAEYEAAVAALRKAQNVAFANMARLAHETALAKVPHVIEHVANALAGGGKVVLFAHHADVIQTIAAEFGDAAVVLTGKTPMAARQGAVERFQNDPRCTLFIGNILAAGVGITLTASSHVIFAEIDWRPAMLSQAEDRTHRIGQTNAVLVQHLVFNDSIDAIKLKKIVAKQAVIDAALDVEGEADEASPAILGQDAPAEASAAAVAAPARALPPLQPAEVEAVRQALQRLAGMDADGARVLNGVGFNRLDSLIGRELAALPRLSPKQAHLGRRIARKYSRQIGADLVAAMGA